MTYPVIPQNIQNRHNARVAQYIAEHSIFSRRDYIDEFSETCSKTDAELAVMTEALHIQLARQAKYEMPTIAGLEFAKSVINNRWISSARDVHALAGE